MVSRRGNHNAICVCSRRIDGNCAFADDGSSKLQGDTLKKAVSGKTVHLATPLGTLPIRFRMNGTMSGTAGDLEKQNAGEHCDEVTSDQEREAT